MLSKKSIMSVESVPTASLKLWKDNPRQNDEAVPRLAELLQMHGQRSPIVVWKKNMVVYKGNTTLKAARSLGWKNISVILADFPSEQAAIAYGIADNKSSEWALWDDELLTKFLSMKEVVKSSGFTEKEHRGLLMLPDLEKINKINEDNSGMKDKIIIMILDAAKKPEVVELLKTWIKTVGLTGIEIK